jgi:hypothetical protein
MAETGNVLQVEDSLTQLDLGAMTKYGAASGGLAMRLARSQLTSICTNLELRTSRWPSQN